MAKASYEKTQFAKNKKAFKKSKSRKSPYVRVRSSTRELLDMA